MAPPRKHTTPDFVERLRGSNDMPKFKSDVWIEKVCACGQKYYTQRPDQKYHNRACSARAVSRMREGKTQTGIVKKIICSVCGMPWRIFDYSQDKEQIKNRICRWCEAERRYQAKSLPTPDAVIAAIRANSGSITYLELQTMFALSNKQSYELVADLVTDGYLRGLEHGRFALGDTAEPGIDL